MIYILGMSHIHPVLDACSANGIDEQLPKIMHDGPPAFAAWDVKPGVLPEPVQAASIYLGQIARHWGQNPAQMTSPGVVGVVPGYQDFLSSIDSSVPGNVLFAFMHGEEYHHMSVRAYNAPYDFCLPARPDLGIAAGRQVVPLELVTQQADYFLQKAIAELYAIRSFHPNLRVVNVICPPPGVAGETHETDPDGAAPPHCVRLKNYLVYAQALQAATQQVGIETLLPPAEALTALGLLREEYVEDPVHGNTRYGALVVEQMNNLVLQGAH